MVEFKPTPGFPDVIDVCVPRFNRPGETKKMSVLKYFEPLYDRIKTMEVYEDDVWVITFPKCGTTWAQEMVWFIQNNLNYEEGAKKDIVLRFPYLEMHGVVPKYPYDNIDLVRNMPRPRFIKSHLCIELLPDQIWTKKPKIVYVARDPRDAAVSLYHFMYKLQDYSITLEDFIDRFMNNHVTFAPFFEHILDFWTMRDAPNFLFLKYEDMKKDLMSVLEQVSMFFGKSYSHQDLLKLKEHLSVDNMRKNPACNNEFLTRVIVESSNSKNTEGFKFIRKGIVGSHKEELSPECIKKFDEWIKKDTENTDYVIDL